VTSAEATLALLHASHDHLAAAVEPLTPEQVTGQAYPTEWSIAQVMSHIGSGAQIFGGLMKAAADGEPAPDFETFKEVWAVWNAKTPGAQAADALAADTAFLDWVDGLTDQQRATFSIDLFGAQQDLVGVLAMRLGEHTLHTWDVLVALDPAATLPADASEAILDGLDRLVARSGKAVAEAKQIAVHTVDPSRQLELSLGTDKAELSEGEPDSPDATVELPAEAFVRLVYGRLDAEHTPTGVTTDGIDLPALRAVFPGF
jgi:uncharacterized protein (TIGR03083 family)